MSTQAQGAVGEMACPECGEALASQPVLADGAIQQTVVCDHCGWRPSTPGGASQQAPPDVEAVETWAVRWLRIATEQVLAPLLIALPGLLVVTMPAWRQAGMVYLLGAYLFAYQVGTWARHR
jgi:hypothetical protein